MGPALGEHNVCECALSANPLGLFAHCSPSLDLRSLFLGPMTNTKCYSVPLVWGLEVEKRLSPGIRDTAQVVTDSFPFYWASSK